MLLARGDIPAARAIHEEVYKARTRILGPEDPDTLRAGRDLVEALYRQGHPTDAAQLQDQLVEAFTSVLGADDLETITSLAYQATLLRDAGQYARARAIEEQVVEDRSRVLGPEHPDTLTARGNLAATLGELGELGKARAIEEQVVEATQPSAGSRTPRHPHRERQPRRDAGRAGGAWQGPRHPGASRGGHAAGCWVQNTPRPSPREAASPRR